MTAILPAASQANTTCPFPKGTVGPGRPLNNDAATLVQVASRLSLSAHVLMF